MMKILADVCNNVIYNEKIFILNSISKEKFKLAMITFFLFLSL